jgi:hypothetical protein
MKQKMLKFYFDHNIWVNLHKNQQLLSEEQRNEDFDEIYKLLVQKKREKKIRLFSNLTQIIECKQRTNQESRESIIKFVISTCDGYFQSPNVYIKQAEISNFCYEWLNRHNEKINIEDRYFGNDFENLMGEYSLIPKDKNNVEIQNKLKKLKEDSRFLINSLYVPMLLKFHEQNSSDNENNVNEHMQIRDSVRNIPTFKGRVDKLMENDFIGLCRRIAESTNEILTKNTKKSNRNKFPNIPNHKERMKFFKKFPHTFTLSYIIAHRNADLKRNIRNNDFYDIANLSVPIAYCDIVVGERSFINLAIQCKLDKTYQTKLLSNLLDLKDVLNEL